MILLSRVPFLLGTQQPCIDSAEQEHVRHDPVERTTREDIEQRHPDGGRDGDVNDKGAGGSEPDLEGSRGSP